MDFPAKPYHTGLSDADRHRNQEDFIKDDIQIIVATVAFGMGINKPNIRFILHYDLPQNMKAIINRSDELAVLRFRLALSLLAYRRSRTAPIYSERANCIASFFADAITVYQIIIRMLRYQSNPKLL